MAKTKRAESALPYIQRLLEDEYVQAQLRQAASGARAAYARARRQPHEAAEDRRLYRNLRHAATSTRNAASALRHPKPEPKHRGRKVAIIGLAIGGCALLTIKLQKLQSQRASDSGATPAQPHQSAMAAAGAPQSVPTAEHPAADTPR